MISAETANKLTVTPICDSCVGEEYLSSDTTLFCEERICHYCGKKAPVITIGDLASEVEAALERHFHTTSDHPSGYDYYLQKEGLWERSGQPVVFVISEAALTDEKPSEDIRKLLEYQTYDHSLAEIGEDGPFDSGMYYEEKSIDDSEYRAAWANFENGIKTESRFFSKFAKNILDDLFKDINKMKTIKGAPVIVKAGPRSDLKSVFRSRIFQSESALKEALKFPDIHLGPPSSRQTLAGRMNPQGISVFYGASTEEIAIAEVRPPVGSKALVGRFKIIRELKLLDVAALQKVPVNGSLFDHAFLGKLERQKFLEHLVFRISQPIMPNDEPFDYLVTQAIAEYLSEIADPPLDGILFKSAQTKKTGKNIVLFHQSSLVEKIKIPKGTEITADNLRDYEDEDYYDDRYHVWEETPEIENKPNDKEKKRLPFDYWNDEEKKFDLRKVTLKLDIKSLCVHRINSVVYRTKKAKVTRSRSVKGDIPF